MREIKFRAWDKIDTIMRDVVELHSSWVAVPVQVSEDEQELQQRHLGDVELLQFTGLNDSRSQPIWEGDIILDRGDKYEVVFNEPEFCVKDKIGDVFTLRKYREVCRVIGNIYENPELLR